MRHFKLWSLLGTMLLIVAVFSTNSAQAQGPFCGPSWGCGGGINYPYGLYGSRVNEVPYFSMFPPVYYSMPVPRTYGWSPFAYPPGTMTPEVVSAPTPPQEIINPHVPQSTPAKPSAETKTTARTVDYKAPEPKEIINPFVKTASTSVASTGVAAAK